METKTKHIFRVYELSVLADENAVLTGDFISMDEVTFVSLN